MTDADLHNDHRLADRLAKLPPPALPPGLAARIVANATRLPQDRDEPAGTPATSIPLERRSRRWLPAAIGTAIAASAVAALFLQQSPAGPAAHDGAVQVVRQAPEPQLHNMPTDLAVAPSPEADRLVVETASATPKPKAAKSAGDARPSPPPESAVPPVRVQPSEEQLPELASQQKTPAGEGPSEQAFVGPPAGDDRGAPMLQSEPSSGFGITGTNGPSAPAPAPSRPGRGATTMPRF